VQSQRQVEDANRTIKLGVKGNQSYQEAQHAAAAADREAKQSVLDLAHTRKEQAYAVSQAIWNTSQTEKQATQSVTDAEYAQQMAYRNVGDEIINGKQTRLDAYNAQVDANNAYNTAATNLDTMAGSLGLTRTAAEQLSTTLTNAEKQYNIAFTADPSHAYNALQGVKRDMDEIILMASGNYTAAQAKAKALKDYPDEHPLSATVTSKTKGQLASTTSQQTHATGGGIYGYGTDTSDNIAAWLSPGEHVWTAREVRNAGGHGAVERMRRQYRYAAGGRVQDPDIEVPIDLDKMNLAQKMRDNVMITLTGLDAAGRQVASGAGGLVQGIKNWLMKVADPLPYVFGAVGPNAYDCSGLVGEVWARLTGHPSYHRYFSTSNEAQYFAPGPGMFTVGINPSTHTMGMIDGLTFEAQDPQNGIVVGAGTSNIFKDFQLVMHLPMDNAPSGGGTPARGDPGKGGHLTPAQARAAGRSLMPGSWSFAALDNVFTRESGWRWNAVNPAGGDPSTSAYGIPQALPGSKMAGMGADWVDNALTQIKFGIQYIGGRYGTPDAAVAHENAYNWYDNGGVLPPGKSVVLNRTRKPEMVLNDTQWKVMRELASRATSGGPIMEVQNQHIHDGADADLLARSLEFAFRTGSV
jgi:hypothetical protein